jgi:phosphoribosyl-ATP pyrophosphohydrolase
MSDILQDLEKVIHERKKGDPDSSYVAKRFAQGTEKIAQKFGEESVETIIAALKGSKDDLIGEGADMMFHFMMLLADRGVSINDVIKELEKRKGTSGLDEKARRKIK